MWTCRYQAIDVVCCTYDFVLSTLEEIADSSNKERAIQATSILYQVKFLLSLIIFHRIFGFITGLSEQLQSTNIDMVKTAGL